ncbi:recombination regulator RecX, partial [Mycobacterium tuberculosis]
VRARLRREVLIDDGTDEARVSRRLVAMLARRGYGQTLACEVVIAELAAERERRRV